MAKPDNYKRVKDMLREVVRIGYNDGFAERQCSLNRARNLLAEIDGMQHVDASELICDVKGEVNRLIDKYGQIGLTM